MKTITKKWNKGKKTIGKLKQVWKDFCDQEDGMGSVEIILILVILVGLVLIFRNQVTKIVENAFKQIKSDSTNVNKKVTISGGY
ncbi:putative uncharacterized protein [Clostridium sp. CAG:411]|jgi:Flp pilus assembly pilin Flp|nr:Flp1 family type IVb pilin [Lachnospiraceae bacterium]CDE43988.1 putative uncharacterized protein [Clostridium sp. CAG:411]